MTRLWELVIGGGIVVCLLALVACAAHMVLEVLAVEASRRKDAGGGELRRTTPPPVPDRVAPSPGVDAAARVVADLEGRAVPVGWRVEWLVEEPEGPGCGPRRTPYLDQIPDVPA